MGKYLIEVNDKGSYYFNLLAGNHEPILHSQMYKGCQEEGTVPCPLTLPAWEPPGAHILRAKRSLWSLCPPCPFHGCGHGGPGRGRDGTSHTVRGSKARTGRQRLQLCAS